MGTKRRIFKKRCLGISPEWEAFEKAGFTNNLEDDRNRMYLGCLDWWNSLSLNYWSPHDSQAQQTFPRTSNAVDGILCLFPKAITAELDYDTLRTINPGLSYKQTWERKQFPDRVILPQSH